MSDLKSSNSVCLYLSYYVIYWALVISDISPSYTGILVISDINPIIYIPSENLRRALVISDISP